MRIADVIRDRVGFLCGKKKGKGASYEPFGNVFIVQHPSIDELNHFIPGYEYLVTAKHLVDKAQGELFLRLNTVDGGKDHIRITGDWRYPKDPPGFESDVALIRFNPPPDQFRYEPIPSYSLIDQHAERQGAGLEHGKVGIGDELCTVGLFTGYYGQNRNIPLLHFGTIAATPDISEPLTDRATQKKYDAYIVEMRSIAGLSGSPVFLLTDPEGRASRRETSPIVTVLGLVRSYWYYNINSGMLNHSSDILSEVNVGLSAVTPAQKILDILQGDDVTKERVKEEEANERFKTKLATGTKAKRTKALPDISRPVFEDALKKASRKVRTDEELNEE